jgi:hypothetical protein
MLGLQTVQDMCVGWNRTGGMRALFDYLTGVRSKVATGT